VAFLEFLRERKHIPRPRAKTPEPPEASESSESGADDGAPESADAPSESAAEES